MPRVPEFFAHPLGYGVTLAIGIGLFMLSVGINAEALSFPRGAAYSDSATSHWPNALFLQQSIRAGQFPLWRPLLMNGEPFAANPLNKVWYPPQWLAVLLPPTLHLNVLLWLHLTLAGVGMRAFARQIGLSVSVASLLGAAYAFTPRLIAAAGAGHLDVVYAVAWFPLVMLGTARLAVSATFKSAALLSLTTALCFLADIRLSVFIFATAAFYALYRWDRHLKSALLYGLAGLMTVGLTATQWLPLLALLPKLSRAGLTVADAGAFSLQAPGLIRLFVADQGGAHETIVYVGLGILLLAVIGLFNHKLKPIPQFWAATALIGALYALGTNSFVWPLLVRVIPLLLLLRVPARAWYVVLFALLILAGRGLMILTDPARRAVLRRWLPIISAVLIGLVIAAAFIAWPVRTAATVLAVLFTGVTILLLNRRSSTAAWTILILIDLLAINVTLIEGRDRADWLDRYRPLAETLITDGVSRVYSPSYSLPQQVAAYWNIPLFGGVDPFQFADYVKVVEAATGVHAQGYSVTLPALEGDPAVVNRDARIDASLLGQWGVSHVVSAFPIDDPDLQILKQTDGVYIYRNQQYQTRTPGVYDDALASQIIGLGITGLSLIVSGSLIWIGSRRVS